jgi:putative ABC transport system substrate-binding protein
MRRREFIGLIGGVAASWPLAGRAQQSDRMRRVGILVAEAVEGDPYYEGRLTSIREGLRALGWIEGQNVKARYSSRRTESGRYPQTCR